MNEQRPQHNVSEDALHNICKPEQIDANQIALSKVLDTLYRRS